MREDVPDFDEVYRETVTAPTPILQVLKWYGSRYQWPLAIGLVTATLNPLLSLVPSYLLGVAIDIVVDGPAAFRLPFIDQAWIPPDLRGQLLLLFVLMGGTGVALLAVETTDGLAWARVGHDVEHDLRTETFDAAQRLGMPFFTSSQTGDVMSVINQDVGAIQGILGGWFKDVYQMAIFSLGMTVVMLSLHWQLTLVTIAFVVPMVAFSLVFHHVISPVYVDLHRERGQYNARLENVISGVETVKANTMEDHELVAVGEQSSIYRDIHIGVQQKWAVWGSGRRLLLETATLAVLLVGGWVVLQDAPEGFFAGITIGTFVTFFFYASQFINRVDTIGRVVNSYSRLAAAGRRVFGLMFYPEMVAEPVQPVPLDRPAGDIRFEGVSFRYPGTEEFAVRDIDLDIEAGSFVGIVGQTGAGKTTLARLLVRFYDPTEGSITLDGRDLRNLSLTELRETIGVVEQEPFLFDDTIRENLTYASRHASEEEMIAATKKARAYEFISELPDGFDTRVGERGVKLSGGQRQRLVMARTILEDPPVVVLDEATSHVDNRTEALIQDSLDELVADRTTIAIAHRLSTVRDADLIVVLEDGRIVEQGTHEDLLARGGAYAGLWNRHIGE